MLESPLSPSFLDTYSRSTSSLVCKALCDLLNLHLAVYFLSMWLSDIITTNSNGDSASPWNIPLWIFASDKLFPLAVNSILKVFNNFLDKF